MFDNNKNNKRSVGMYLLAEDRIIFLSGFGQVVSLVDIKATVHFDSGWRATFARIRWTVTCLPT